MNFLGIDIGTTFIKGAILDLDKYQIRNIQRIPFPDAITGLPLFHREFNADEILNVTQKLIDSLISLVPDCSGIVMCSQLHGLVFTTDKGHPLSNVINWQDQRALEPHFSGKGTYFDIQMQEITPDERRQLGNEPRPGVPICFLYWLVEHNKLPPKNVFPTSLPNFIIANLCSSTPVCEITHAMAYGVLDLERLNWHEEVIYKFGLEKLSWPEIKPQGQVIGLMKTSLGFIPCYTPVGDFQCAQLGASLEELELSINISTGSAVTKLSPYLEFGDFQTRPFFDGNFLNTITHIPAGRALNLLVSLISEMAQGHNIPLSDIWDLIENDAKKVGNTDLKVNLAFYASAFGDRGVISNIHEGNLSIGHLFNAAFRNMAKNYYSSAIRLSPEKNWQKLVFSGGIAQKIEYLRHVILEEFRSDYRICVTPEDTLLGLLTLALSFSGREKSVEDAMKKLELRFSGAFSE